MSADKRLGYAPRLVAVLVGEHIDGDRAGHRGTWQAWPGRERLANMAGTSTDQVSVYLAALRDTGWLTQIRRDRTRVYYALTWGLPTRWSDDVSGLSLPAEPEGSGSASLPAEPEGSGAASLPAEPEGSDVEPPGSAGSSLPAEPGQASLLSREVGGVGGAIKGAPPTTTDRAASARTPTRLSPVGAGLRLDLIDYRTGHAMALVVMRDSTDVDPTTAHDVWHAVRDHHDVECVAAGCVSLKRHDRSGGVVVSRPAEDLDGLVNDLRAAGVEVPTAVHPAA